jgi:hypothetical protein
VKHPPDWIKFVDQFIEVAGKNHWHIIDCQENIGMVSFQRINGDDYERINIYITTMTVATCVNHPNRGRTQLFRKRQSVDDIKKIFQNPRRHTGVGYYG